MEIDEVLSGCTNVIELTRGGQKIVYKATHPKYGLVAIKKIIHSDNAISIERLHREIRAVEIINSKFIPHIYEHNCDSAAKTFYIIEQFIDGKTLRDIMIKKTTFTINDIVFFLSSMLNILTESEKQHIIHRDIKPENIMVDNNGNYWLLDFGISRHLDLQSITADNQPLGLFTIGYASSEQFRNIKNQIDIRADLFALGVVANEMLMGTNYYTNGAENFQTVLHRIDNSPVPLTQIKGDSQFQLATFIHMLGDNRQTRRPRTAYEARQILEIIKPTLNLEK